MKDNTQRAKTAMIMLWIMLGLECIMLLSSYLQYDLLHQLNEGTYFTEDEMTANDLREMVVGILYLIAYIITAVVYIQWFRRAYFNLHTKVKGLSHDEGWAAGAWFVPFLNLFRPYQIMKELYRESSKLLEAHGNDFRNSLNLNFVNLWWGMWVITNFISSGTTRRALRAETIDDFIQSTSIEMFASGVSIPMTLLAIKVVYDYSNIEPMLYQLPTDGGSNFTYYEKDDLLDTPL